MAVVGAGGGGGGSSGVDRNDAAGRKLPCGGLAGFATRPGSGRAVAEWTPFHPPNSSTDNVKRASGSTNTCCHTVAPTRSPILTMSAVQKIAVHSLSGKQAHHTTSFPSFTNQTILEDLKNTTDDALPNYLHSLKFKQIHTQTDVRLAIGYVAVAIAGALFFFDWKFGWDASRPYTAPAVAAYFILNGAFSYWLWFVEKGVVYEGEGKTGKVCVYPSTAYIMGKQ
jgi:hypothetical protein